MVPSPKLVRELCYRERPGFGGWVCHGCGWEFHPPPLIKAESFEELMEKFESLRDYEFRDHRCVDFPVKKKEL